ncbi:hypothetical protein PVAND_005311 [Polypedilum vanderplanki]|uniref:K Homology domain-containing protein n=1 Tax=Polypedilum vanderplanki TaxID=319348 RepID=A0A9J6C0Q9_POLVA|nr:hypothetical protein PVAND_005311 [Polypedilum vanderplanki]
MSDYSSNFNNITALQKARQVAAKLQLAGPNNKRPHEEDDLEPHTKRFSGNSSSMSPAHLQQAQQAAAQVAARLGQPPNYQNAIPNPEAVEKAKQLINKFIPQSGGGGGGSNQNNQASRPGLGSNAFTEIMIPGPKVGLIIGKGGLTIKQLQEKTGAKMIIIQDNPNPEMEKPLRISGEASNVEHAKQLVYDLIQDKGNDGSNQQQQQSNNRNNNYNNNSNHGAAYSSGGNQGRNNNNGGSGDQIEVFVPKAAVGVVIGKEGGMIKKIQADTGCKLQFLQTKGEGLGDRQCIVQGTKQQVDDGKRMIEDLIDSVLRRNNNSGNNDNWNSNGSNSGYQQQQSHQQNQQNMGGGGVQVVQQQYEFTVPTSKCGIIIGRGGDTIKQINQQSGAHCEMDRKKSASQTNEKTFSIRGEQHQIDEAKRLIQEKINMDIDLQHTGAVTVTQAASNAYGQNLQNPYQAWGGSGGYNQGWDQSQGGQMPNQPGAMPDGNSNQPDYSLQWIEYYRSMGMHQQAEAIEAQIKARGGSGASGAPGMTQGNPPQGANRPDQSGPEGNTRDYSQEWANYYRQIGKIEEAEAIERQIKGRGSSNQGGNQPNFPAGNYQQPQQYGQQYGQQNYGANYQQYQQQYHGNGQNNSNNDKW